MKYIIALLILLSVFNTNAQPDSLLRHIVVIKNGSKIEVQGEPVKKLKFTSELFLHLCTYPYMIKYLKKEAARYNANVIKITKLKYPNMLTPCYRSTTLFYKVADPTDYIEETIWKKDKKLTWKDFKCTKTPTKKKEIKTTSSKFVITMVMIPGITPANPMKYKVKAVFLNHQSYVTIDANERNDSLLLYQQIKFNLCEMYARLLYKKLLNAKLLYQNKEPAYNLKKRIESQYAERIKILNKETNLGSNTPILQKWYQQIEKELLELEAYANHN